MASELRVNQITSITGVGTVTFDAGGVTFAGSPNLGNAAITSINSGPISGARNKIINGDMRLDQRNAGASVTVTGDGFGSRLFIVDRFTIQKSGACQIAGIQTTDVPTGQGFSNALRATVSTADSSVTGGDYAIINYRNEGYNVADFEYGTSTAKTSILSFWVKSSVPGIYCVSFSNYADTRFRVQEYTISSANTWEYKTMVVPGDTTGTWEKTNSGGLNIAWCLGSGSFVTGNIWQTTANNGTTSQTQWISTASATFFLTGVQLESGTIATPFERRSYGQELALCQRYFTRLNSPRSRGVFNSTTASNRNGVSLPVTMRTSPNMTIGGTLRWYDGTATGTITSFVQTWSTPESIEFDSNVASGTATANRPSIIYFNSLTEGYIDCSAEL